MFITIRTVQFVGKGLREPVNGFSTAKCFSHISMDGPTLCGVGEDQALENQLWREFGPP